MEHTRTGNPSIAPGFSGNSNGAMHTATSTAHDAVNSAAGMAEDAARKVKPTIDRVAAMAHHAVDSAVEVAAPTVDYLAAQGAHLKAVQHKLMDDTCSYVAANPLKSVGIALLAGFVLSRVVLR